MAQKTIAKMFLYGTFIVMAMRGRAMVAEEKGSVNPFFQDATMGY
jgi:hypothetical protein